MLLKRRGVPARWLVLYVSARALRAARAAAMSNGGYYSVRCAVDEAEQKLCQAVCELEEHEIKWS